MNSSYTPIHERYRSQSASCDDYRQKGEFNRSAFPELQPISDMSHRLQQMRVGPSGYGHAREFYEHDLNHRSKYDEMEWNGYLSDHGQYQRPPNSYYHHRRPRSATGLKHSKLSCQSDPHIYFSC